MQVGRRGEQVSANEADVRRVCFGGGIRLERSTRNTGGKQNTGNTGEQEAGSRKRQQDTGWYNYKMKQEVIDQNQNHGRMWYVPLLFEWQHALCAGMDSISLCKMWWLVLSQHDFTVFHRGSCLVFSVFKCPSWMFNKGWGQVTVLEIRSCKALKCVWGHYVFF